MDELLGRINELAKKKREEGLTLEEEAEQKDLYKKYLTQFRASFTRQLENTDVEYDDGTVVPLTELKKKKED